MKVIFKYSNSHHFRYYNSGDGPTANILLKHPELVHREETRLGVKFMINELYKSSNYTWRENLDTIHLLTKHRIYLDMTNIKLYNYFNERNIIHYPFTFGEMARRVMNYSPPGNFTVHSVWCKTSSIKDLDYQRFIYHFSGKMVK